MTRRRVALGVFAALLVGLVALPLVRNREGTTREAFLADNAAFTRRVVLLAKGATHYEFVDGKGPVVVLVHGVSGPMSVWDETLRTLSANGRPVLRLDLYGRGGSERLEPPSYDLETFATQVTELVDRVVPGRRLHLVGSSMGAIVVTEVQRRLGPRVASVVFMGPAGFPLEASPLARLTGVPLLGEYLMASFGDGMLAKHQRRYFVEPGRFEAQHALFEAQLRVRGSKRAILETTRRVPLQTYADRYASLAASPVLVFWGIEDRAFPYEHAVTLRHALPAATVIEVPSAGHLPQLERADAVMPRLVAWLDGHD